MQFSKQIKRADKSNAIDLYVTNQIKNLQEFDKLFEVPPPVFSQEIKLDWMKNLNRVVVSSDAFFPFPDNIERLAQSGVSAVAAPSGSNMDAVVIEAAQSLHLSLIFLKNRLFHH